METVNVSWTVIAIGGGASCRHESVPPARGLQKARDPTHQKTKARDEARGPNASSNPVHTENAMTHRTGKLNRIFTIAFGLSIAACSESSSPTAPRQASRTSFDNTVAEGSMPYETATVIACGSAMFSVTGHGTITYRTREDNSGGLHMDVTIDETLSATDVAGISYSGSSTNKNTTNVPEPPFETTSITSTRLHSDAPVADHMFHTTFHLTMNANGQVTSSVLNYNCD